MRTVVARVLSTDVTFAERLEQESDLYLTLVPLARAVLGSNLIGEFLVTHDIFLGVLVRCFAQ